MYMGHSMMERRHNGVFRSITRSVCVLVTFVAWHVSEPCVEASTARPFHPRAFVSCSNTVPSVSCLSFPFLNIGNREVYSKLHKRQMGQYLNRSQPLYAGDLTRLQQLNKVCTDTKPKLQACDWNPQADPLLEIRGLKAKASEDGTLILNGVDLVVKQGETHAIMGRNGSGKSTLSKVLAGHPNYEVISGSVKYKGMDLLSMPVHHRAISGIFLAFQYPLEIPMVSGFEMLRTALNARRAARNEEEADAEEFESIVRPLMKVVDLPVSFLRRPLNYGFSGGEKKRNELLQLLVLNPSLALLDETDSGLDVDSFRTATRAIQEYAKRGDASLLVTTHYRKMLEAVPPNKVHVMHKGQIIESGGMELVKHIEDAGFEELLHQ